MNRSLPAGLALLAVLLGVEAILFAWYLPTIGFAAGVLSVALSLAARAGPVRGYRMTANVALALVGVAVLFFLTPGDLPRHHWRRWFGRRDRCRHQIGPDPSLRRPQPRKVRALCVRFG